MSSIATQGFLRGYNTIYKTLPQKDVSFDCRIFQVPNKSELANCFVWRCNDAIKNSISMVAQSNFSHKQLQGKKSQEMIDMLRDKNVNYYKDFPINIRQGIFYTRVNIKIPLTNEMKKYKINQNKQTCIRTFTEEITLTQGISKVLNKTEVLFQQEQPIYKGEE